MAAFELRLGDFRVLYKVEEADLEVVILIVGRKVGNRLLVEGEEFHGHEVIPPRELEADTEGYLRRCLQSGQSLVVQLPDSGLVAIQPIDADDDLVNELIEHDRAFRALLAKSAASPRKPFQPATAPEEMRRGLGDEGAVE